MSREFKEYFLSPGFYIVSAIILGLAGHRAYSLTISYMDTISSYPDYIFGGEISNLAGLSVNTFIFPRLFDYYSYLVLFIVPLISFPLIRDLANSVDRIELSGRNLSELAYLLRKALASSAVISTILLPTVLYPLMLSVFTSVDFAIVASSYLGVLLLILVSSCLVLPVAVSGMPLYISVLTNMALLMFFYSYFFTLELSPFLYGLIVPFTVLEALLFSFLLLFISSKLLQHRRIHI